MSRRRLGLVAVATLAVGIALRAATLHWSPLPATLDGFRYAALARDLLATGRVPVETIDSDELVFTGLLAAVSEVSGVRPLHAAQPLVACVGGASVLGVVAIARRLVPSEWAGRDVRTVALVVGLTFAVEGLYLRRSGVPDEEAAALLLLPLFALAVHRLFTAPQRSWAVVAGLLALAFPPLHNFSSAIAALSVTALAVIHIARTPARRSAGLAGALTAGFWAYFFGFFAIADRLGLRLTYSGLIGDHLGVFVAWIVLLGILVAWLATTTDRARRMAAAVALFPLFGVVAVNLLVPVFPATIRTPPLVLALVVPFIVPVLLFVWGAPRLARGDGRLVLALAAGPLAMVWFTLTTSLTPAFFGAVMRAQTFAHAAVVAGAGVTAVALRRRRPVLGRVAVVALVAAAVVTVPLGFVHLDTGTAPRTVHESEFAASSFATQYSSAVASDHRLARAGPLAHEATVTTAVLPVRSWIAGGHPPSCPTLIQDAWTTEGAHFYPTSPGTIAESRLARWRAENQLVYTVGGRTVSSLVVPRTGTGTC